MAEADDPKSPTPPSPPEAAADKPASQAPGEPLKAEVSRTDAPGAGASAAPSAPAAPPPSGPTEPPPPADKTPPPFIASLQAAVAESVSHISYWVGDWTIVVPAEKL